MFFVKFNYAVFQMFKYCHFVAILKRSLLGKRLQKVKRYRYGKDKMAGATDTSLCFSQDALSAKKCWGNLFYRLTL